MERHRDHRFIEALRSGDQTLVREIYSTYTPDVIKWVLKNNGSIADAKDVFQEGLMSIYNKALDDQFVLNYPFGALLFTICKNKWLDQLRKKNTSERVRNEAASRLYTEDAIIPLVEQIEEEEIRSSKLDSAFSQLSDLCQQMLSLIGKGMAATEIAIQLNMNEANTVYRRKKACIERWKTLYKSTPIYGNR